MEHYRTASPGCVYLIGAGPGDPGLMTMRGAEILRQASMVFYDRLANPEILELLRCHGGKTAGAEARNSLACRSQEA